MNQILLDYLNNGREERYLEYKGDVPWTDHHKQQEIIKTILAFSNLNDGGVLIIGLDNNGTKIGLSDANYTTYDHDKINQYLSGKTNIPIECKVMKIEIEGKKYIIIQVSGSKEYPIIYTGGLILKNISAPALTSNIALRPMALYIRGKLNICTKEIDTIDEWQEVIERTIRKYEQETMRRVNTTTTKSEKIKYSDLYKL